MAQVWRVGKLLIRGGTGVVKEQLMLAIAKSVERVVAVHENGSRTVYGLDAATTEKIANAVLAFIADPPIDDSCRNYDAGLYSRRNLEAFAEDMR